MDLKFPPSVVKTLGEVVNVVEERPVVRSIRSDTLVAGDAAGFLDLLLVNTIGKEKVIRVPVSEDVVEFYAATR